MKKYWLFIIAFIFIVLGIILSFFTDNSEKMTDNYTYICQKTIYNEEKTLINLVKPKLDSDNKIICVFYEERNTFNNKTDFFNAVYNASISTADYTIDEGTLTLIIYSDCEELYDEEGYTINPNYSDYIKSYIKDNYTCDYEK